MKTSVWLLAALLLVACSERKPAVRDTAYWQGKYAKGDSEAMKALAAEGAKALPTLKALLQDQSVTVVQNAAMTMGDLGAVAAPAIPDLIQALGRFPDNPFLRQTLKGLGGEAVPAMVDALKTGSPEQRAAVANVLAGVGDAGEPALPVLISILESGGPDKVVEEAIAATAAISVKAVRGDALPALEALKAKGGDLGTYANNAIRRIEHAIKQAAKIAAENAAGN